MRNLLAVLVVGLVVYTVIDVLRSEPAERHGFARPLWVLLILLLPVVGSVVWLVARQQARAGGSGGPSGGTGRGPAPRGPRRPPGPVAPDDDPEFLWRLEQQQRRQRQGGAAGGTTPPSPAGDTEGETPGAPRT